MKIQQHDPQKTVTSILSSHISKTVKSWHREVSDEPLTYEEFSKWKLPKRDLPTVPMPSQFTLEDGIDAVPVQTAANLLNAKRATNAIVYNPMSGMYWHTNSDLPGTRMYYTFTLDKAVFKYIDPDTGNVYEDWDTVGGWTARSFEVTAENPLWHCVWTSGRRFSFGFMI